jgi:para-aminobenzoate synthetase/4-amino-4-deoxychorismate lyase
MAVDERRLFQESVNPVHGLRVDRLRRSGGSDKRKRGCGEEAGGEFHARRFKAIIERRNWACVSRPAKQWKGMDQPRRRDLEELMDFDPEEGIANLEEHLDRLKAQAEALGYDFDRHAARNELQAATFGKKKSGKARLLVSPSGAIAIELKTFS